MEMEMENKEFGRCLIEKILVWLPVVSLLRFKAVCRSWRDLIQSPFFIHLHTPITLNSSSSSKFGSFIVHANRSDYVDSDTLLMLSSPSDDDQEEDLVPVVDNLGFDMDRKAIVGSCNGLVCLSLYDRSRGPRPPHQVSLWNPATGQISVLPESNTIPDGCLSLFAFGFDVETKDYKVVRFTSLKRRCNGNGSMFCFCGVQVYSLSTDSWRLLEGIPCLPGYPFQMQDSVVYLNGTGFFLAHYFYTKRHPCLDLNDRFIISFDFTKEIITPIPLPDHDREQDLCLCSWGGDKLALFSSPKQYARFRSPNFQDFNIWVLNYERGSSSSVTKESWTKLHSFQLQLECGGTKQWYEPKGISNDGKFALLQQTLYGYDKMNLYNFATKEVKRDFLFCRRLSRSKAHAYNLSLVSVIGGNVAAGEMVQGQAAAAATNMVIENSSTNL